MFSFTGIMLWSGMQFVADSRYSLHVVEFINDEKNILFRQKKNALYIVCGVLLNKCAKMNTVSFPQVYSGKISRNTVHLGFI